MTINGSVLYTCPHCGHKKPLLGIMSGNTFGAERWSDLKLNAPMLPEISILQKCPSCGKFFSILNQSYEHGDDDSFDLGTLSFEEEKQALEQLSGIGFSSVISEFRHRLHFLQAYNDHYHRINSTSPIPEIDRELFVVNIQSLLGLDSWSSEPNLILLKSELYREVGLWKECIDLLNMNLELIPDSMSAVSSEILKRAEAKDDIVFKLE